MADDDAVEIPEDDDEVEEVAVKPQLFINTADLPATARELRGLFVADGGLYERNRVAVEIMRDADGALFTQELKTNNVITRAHELCQPVQNKKRGPTDVTLPDKVANLWLDHNDYGLRPLAGITTAPILRADGSILCEQGYDRETQMYVDAPPAVRVKANPNKQDAEKALRVLRDTFKTFPFDDAVMVDRGDGMKVVDLAKPPGFAESSYLVGLLTAVARSSLWLAPGLLIHAPQMSGSGSGKGFLARAAALIAYGIHISAFAHGGEGAEFDKRVGAALLSGRSVVFTDNINDRKVRSETLSSAITERPAEIRILGFSRMVALNATAFIVLTGNGLTVTEDLGRRFLPPRIDPRMENPELRPFRPGFLDDIMNRRSELLEACLTILRYGRLHAKELKHGRPLGSFEQWALWVRDPLLTLGCEDPVEEMLRAKQNDPTRRDLRQLFATWYECHESDPVAASDLHQDVLDLINPQNRPRQFVATVVESYVGSRIGGFVLTRSKLGKWSTALYALLPTGDGQYKEEPIRERKADASAEEKPMTPMPTPRIFRPTENSPGDRDVDEPMTPMTPMPFRPTSPQIFHTAKNHYEVIQNHEDEVDEYLPDREIRRDVGGDGIGVIGVIGSEPPSRQEDTADGGDKVAYRSYRDMRDAEARRSIAELWADPAYRNMREAALSRRVHEYEEEERRERIILRRPDK
jgi:hypothetical protein